MSSRAPRLRAMVTNGSMTNAASTWCRSTAASMDGNGSSTSLISAMSTPLASNAALSATSLTFLSVLTAICLPANAVGVVIGLSGATMMAEKSVSGSEPTAVPGAMIFTGRPLLRPSRTDTMLDPPICICPETRLGMIAAPPCWTTSSTVSRCSAKIPFCTPNATKEAGAPSTSPTLMATGAARLEPVWAVGVVPPPPQADTASSAAMPSATAFRDPAAQWRAMGPPPSQIKQAMRVAVEDRGALVVVEADLLEIRDGGPDVTGSLLGVERAVGGKQNALRAVEIDCAPQCVRRPEHRGVGVEHPEILKGSARQRIPLDQLPLAVRGALAELVPSRPDPPGEMRHHATAVMDQELHAGMPFEHTPEHDPGHERGQVVLPAKGPPYLIPRPLLGGIVRPVRIAARVYLHEPIKLRHLRVERLEPILIH